MIYTKLIVSLIAKYVYRGDGTRAWKEMANGTRTYFYYNGAQMIAASNGNDASTLLLWGADGLIGSRSLNSTTGATSKSYNLYDPQGNLAQTLDGNGAVVSQSASNAWGEPLRDVNGNASGAGYGAKFGYVRDSESGFYLCTLRYYDPSGGRWISRDPIGYAGGSDLYGYVGNDPVNKVDPSGLEEFVPTPATGDPYADFMNQQQDAQRAKDVAWRNQIYNQIPQHNPNDGHGTLSMGMGFNVNYFLGHGNINWKLGYSGDPCKGRNFGFLLTVGGGPGAGLGFGSNVFVETTDGRSLIDLTGPGTSTGASWLFAGYDRVTSGPVTGHSFGLGLSPGTPEAHHDFTQSGGSWGEWGGRKCACK